MCITQTLFYILITPDNYFGGGGSLGNRYFLNIFPFFFFLVNLTNKWSQYKHRNHLKTKWF